VSKKIIKVLITGFYGLDVEIMSLSRLYLFKKALKKEMTLILIVAILFAGESLPIINTSASGSSECFINSETIYLLAVSQDPVTGKYIGVATEAIVSLSRGEGAVYISVEPMSQIDMQASLNIAYLIASHVSKVNISKYNVYVRVVSDTPIIGGPSASGFLTVAITSLLLNQTLRRDTVMTGMIMPDGLIGPVGGIPEKLLAARSVGAKVMLIPAGQRYSTDLNTGQKVDVVSKGAELGIKIVEVANIYDALRNFGINVSEPKPTDPMINPDITMIYREWVQKLNSTLNDLKRDIMYLSSNISLSPTLKNIVSTYMSLVNNSSSRGYEEYTREDIYSSASDYFIAVIYADTIRWIYLLSKNISRYNDLYDTIKDQYRYAYDKYRSILESILRRGYVDLSKLAVLNEVSYRIYEANTTLNNLPRPGARVLTLDDIYNAVYTLWRINSSLEWMRLYDLTPPSNTYVSLSTLRRYSYTLINYVQTLLIYLNSLGVMLDSSTATKISSMINLATILYREGDYIAVNSLATYLSSLTTAYMNTYFTTNLTETINNVRDLALRYLSELKTRNIDISIPSTYILRGDSLRSTDPATAIYFYELSIADTMWLITLASLKISEYATITTSTITITTSTVSTKTTTTSEEEFVSIPSQNKYMALISIITLLAAVIITLTLLYLFERRRRK